MKTLVEYIKEQEVEFWKNYPSMVLHCEPPYWELQRRNKWIDWFYEGLECPQNVIEAAKDYNNDPILEMLNTHSVDKLIDKIKNEYDDIDIHRIYGTSDDIIEPKSGFYIADNKKEKLEELLKDKKLNNILDFFNYYFTQYYYSRDEDLWYALFDPRYSKKIKDFYKRNNGVAYHITTRKIYEENIKENGLKVKNPSSNQRNSYRYYPNRIYLILPNVDSIKERNEIIKSTIKLLNKEDFVILQVSLQKLSNFNVYEDVTMNTDKEHFIYTYQDIPSKFIKDITYKFKK